MSGIPIGSSTLEVDESALQGSPISESDSLKIIGHGLEIVETTYIKELVEQLGESFERRYFTVSECNAYESGDKRIQYLAGRFAAKKAILNTLGKEGGKDTSFLDIEVKRLPTGQPSVLLHGQCLEIATKFGITKWLLSISHTFSYAAASVFALGSKG
ncbi:MAG: holo-[acyl-carrier-protein] synthase [Symploca sp. SIO3C6]|uniref:Holo-[acyl-carrier-protein] synthase n=1 Tax=Symploca sp. SIO1C4 TaxID=2607765 RepID=A0A6B3NIJ3_9CYAN|nr:holo-[acyl-carrier-protein] synthase [Symploca sp. SIO3C6]NER31483.1 holo-[acyl-carrier-protein] synthase [Symploca sp. SIO1C4]